MEDREKYILDLIDQGYDICIPGGTGRNGSNAAFNALGVRLPNGKGEIWVIPIKRKPFEEYLEQQKISCTLPYENPWAIIKREIKEEIKVDINLSKTFLIANKPETDSRDSNKIHRKYLFVSENYDARFIRNYLSAQEPNLGVPFLIPMYLFEKYLWEGHRWMIEPVKIYFKYRSEYFPPKRQVMPLYALPKKFTPAVAV